MTVTLDSAVAGEVTVRQSADDEAPAPAVRPGSLPGWQVQMPLRRVLIAEGVAAVAVLALARVAVWWALIPVVLVVLLVSTVTYREATASRWLHRAWTLRGMRRRERRRATRAVIPEPFSVELPGVGPIGMRWDGEYALTMIALHGQEYAETALIPEGVDTRDVMPLEACAALLRQFGGLELHSVDVVSEGTRTASDGWYTPRYAEIIADRAAVGIRRTWLVLRLRPQACLQAMAYRASVAQAAAAATERIRQAAARDGCRAVTCSPEQLSEATAILLDNRDLDSYSERWTDLRVGDDYVSVYRVAGKDLTTRHLNDLWTIRAKKTVVLLRLTRDEASGELLVSCLLRIHTANPQPHPPISTLQSVPGQTFAALLAALPLGDRSVELALSARSVAQPELRVPVGPSGFLHGMAERAGVPYLLSWSDPQRFVRVGVAASLEVVEALILRATAAGATAEIHTVRPRLWQPICDGTRITLARPGERSDDAILVVADGDQPRKVLGSSGERGHTLVTVVDSDALLPEDTDIQIRQVSEQRITVLTPVRDREIQLGIMRPRNESQSLAHLRAKRGAR